jgi:hypothetical protein
VRTAAARVHVPLVGALLVVATLAATTRTAITGSGSRIVAVLIGVVAIALLHRQLLRWSALVGVLVGVIFFIPVDRYTFPVNLPFQLEPYRVLAAFIIIGWLTSLLIDPRVKLRATGYEGPLAAFVAIAVISLVLNPDRVRAAGSVCEKSLMFFMTFLLVIFVVKSVVKTTRELDVLVKVIVAGGAVVALAATYESRTHYNVFNHLTSWLPFLRLGAIPFANGVDLTGMSRGGDVRAYASAQHPIAAGALFAMLVPLGFYLVKSHKRWYWWLCTALLMIGVFATVSRTGFMMLIAAFVVLVSIRPRELKRYWPALIPAVAVIHFAVPGTLGSVVQAFFPKGGLLAQEHKNAVGSGRLATLWPVLRTEFAPNPVFGEGFMTRVTVPAPGVPANGPIMDDQWANILVQTGILGAVALAWFFVRAVRLALRRARSDTGDDAVRAAAFAASIAAYAFGMLTFDAFTFTQVTFVAFILLALNTVAVGSTYPARVVLRAVPSPA